jgi:hypothetical protein
MTPHTCGKSESRLVEDTREERPDKLWLKHVAAAIKETKGEGYNKVMRVHAGHR